MCASHMLPRVNGV